MPEIIETSNEPNLFLHLHKPSGTYFFGGPGKLIFDAVSFIRTGCPVFRVLKDEERHNFHSIEFNSALDLFSISDECYVRFYEMTTCMDGLSFAIVGIIPANSGVGEPGRLVLLPISEDAIFRTFGYSITISVNNELFNDEIIQSEDSQFYVGGAYKTKEGRIIVIRGLTKDSPNTFYDQYHHHRYHSASHGLGRVTGTAHDGSCPANIPSNNRPAGIATLVLKELSSESQ